MALSVELIAESMEKFGVELLLAQDRPFAFRTIQMLSAETAETLSEDVLYIAEPKVLYKLSKSKFRDHCFVFRGKVQQIERYRSFVNAIVFGESYTLGDVVNHLMNLFAYVNGLEQELSQAVLQRAGYEPIMGVAKKMIPEGVLLLMDSAYNIIASTHEHVACNAYVDGLLRNKFYDKLSLDRMAAMGYFDERDKYLEPILVEPPNICDCPVMLRSYHENGTFFTFVSCYFPTHSPTLLEQYFVLCITEQIDRYFKASGFYDHSIPRRQQLIDDLIHNRDANQEFISNRCKELRIPQEGDFRLAYIDLAQDHALKASHLGVQLRVWCTVPHYGVFQYHNSVILLLRDWHNCGVAEREAYREQWKETMEIITAHQGVMGVSLLFHSIQKFGVAFSQAESAIQFGLRYAPGEMEFHYSKYYLYDMLECYREKFELEDVYIPYIDRLENENSGAYSNLVLLYYYIISERNISLTAKRVHMHRNSIIYRLQKIQDFLEIDMDDPDVRLRLMISFRILEMTGRLQLPLEQEAPDGRELEDLEHPPLVE